LKRFNWNALVGVVGPSYFLTATDVGPWPNVKRKVI